jgi:hypothetical protein
VSEEADRVTRDDIDLVEGSLGFRIEVDGERVGYVEGVPGYMEYLTVEQPNEGKGIARATLRKFVELSLVYGESEITATNATHDAMEHILETEDDWERQDDDSWKWVGVNNLRGLDTTTI